MLSRSDVWFLVWIGILSVVSLYSHDPRAAFAGWIGRGHGVAVFVALWGIKKAVESIGLFQQSIFRRLMVLLAGMTVVFPIFQRLASLCISTNVGLINERAIGFMGEPNAAGIMSVIMGMTYLVSYGRTRSLWYGSICLFVIAASVYVTGSKTAGLALLLYMISIGVSLVALRLHRLILVIVTLCCISVGMLVMWSGIVDRQNGFPEYESHARIVRYGIDLLGVRPFGYGAESLERPYERRYIEDNIRLVDLSIDRSHNVILDIALWSGIAGMIVWVTWYISMLRAVSLYRTSFMLILAILLYGWFQPIPIAAWIFWMIAWAEPEHMDTELTPPHASE